ncbi:MAG: AAA domain-containing protein [Chloroflexi bacterium AL-W]|nr:AAA domain-containing protein [Chloroflexi bacterium AL-N1]NOK66287.1 AAA domain-containing protein [Chloroflexi bacterium AL-N10]NOK73167.1 AAA domain-containing protein [Chloroflexi bacterium AL-N5]NOK80064.1 AAA domain-containing protein [Chloroflexi bacterium AL-W]NOK88081.1 AAA domain-containing protein [Chloroflexi bacterium AL-N15]
MRYTTTVALTIRATDAQQEYHAFQWLVGQASAEWIQLFATDLCQQMRTMGQMGALVKLMANDTMFQDFLDDYQRMLNE